MAERLENLRTKLRELEAEVAQGNELDAHTRATMAEVADQIRAILQQDQPDTPVPETLLERLQQEERAFEASHPRLTQALAQIINALGQIGI